MTIKKAILFMLLFLCIIVVLHAENETNALEAVKNIEVKVAIIGPDYPLYSWWGHVSIILEDTQTGEANSYDYGYFSFDQDNFIGNFIMGRLYFLKARGQADRLLKYQKYLNRDVTIYTLNVSLENKLKLSRFLENDILPENRIYLYDHFYDNCSTRIRDEMDIITDGQFSKTYNIASGQTLREQLRRFTYSYKFMDWLLNFAISSMADKPATVYDGMFLPKELGLGIEKMMLKNNDGTTSSFVVKKEIFNKAEGRVSIPDTPKPRWSLGLLVGIILGGIAAICLRFKKGLAIFSLIISFFVAIPGSLLFFMSLFTNHTCTHGNINLLVINPAFIILLIFSIRAIVKGEEHLHPVKIFWTIETFLIFASFLIKIVPALRQDNIDTLLILLPMSLILSNLPSFVKSRFFVK